MRASSELKTWILAAAVAWAGVGLLVEFHGSMSLYDLRNERPVAPALWHLGTRPPARLQACLARVERRLPEHATVSLLSPPGPAQAEFYRWRWAAYFLPRHDVLVEDSTRGETPRDFLVSFQRVAEDRWLTPIFGLPGCGLYRVAPVEPPVDRTAMP
jgi:hypothetical protein